MTIEVRLEGVHASAALSRQFEGDPQTFSAVVGLLEISLVQFDLVFPRATQVAFVGDLGEFTKYRRGAARLADDEGRFVLTLESKSLTGSAWIPIEVRQQARQPSRGEDDGRFDVRARFDLAGERVREIANRFSSYLTLDG